MTEHNFKVGDWVRCIKGSSFSTPNGKHNVGFIGKISSFGHDAGSVVFFENGHKGNIEYYEPWTPRVGERVVVKWTGWDGDGIVKKIWYDRDYIVTMKSGYQEGCDGGFPLAFLSPAISPVRTVSRKEVVPGVYGDVSVGKTQNDTANIYIVQGYYGATQLRNIAATLTEIADALDSNS